MSASESPWYVRNRGKVLGPFGWYELEAMRDRGQLARFHEVSQDRRTWIAAASLADLFPARGDSPRAGGGSGNANDGGYAIAGGTPPSQSSSSSYSAAPADEAWYLSRGRGQEGPFGFEDLRRMAASGEITGEALVWKGGMADWTPCKQFPDFTAAGRWGSSPPATMPVAMPTPMPMPMSGGAAYYGPAGYAYPQPPRTSGLAIASLVLGILVLCGLGSLLATIFGAVSLNQISRSNGTLGGKGMAIAGLVLGIIGLGFFGYFFLTGMLEGVAEGMRRRAL